MMRIRRISLILFLLYSAFLIGIYFHSHQQDVSVECKLCQLTYISYVSTVVQDANPLLQRIGQIEPAMVFSGDRQFYSKLATRSPPLF